MYSGTIKYRVYKKDIIHYRIECFDPILREWKEVTSEYPDKLTLFNCKMIVDKELRIKCITEKLDGENAPVHAWIECEGYIRENISLSNILYYNPYKVENFVDRISRKVIDFCKLVTIEGNLLHYSL